MIRSKFLCFMTFAISLLLISFGSFSSDVRKTPRDILPIAASIVGGETYVYGLVSTSHYKVSVEVKPEQYVIAMSGEPIVVPLSNYDIGKEGFQWETLSLAIGLFMLATLLLYVTSVSTQENYRGTKPYSDS